MKVTLLGRVVALMMQAIAQSAVHRAQSACLRVTLDRVRRENGNLAARVALAELRARNLQTLCDALRDAADERSRAERQAEAPERR